MPPDPSRSDLHVVVLAAGEGRRMRSDRPKVLQLLGGQPMLGHVLEALVPLGPAAVHVVVGAGAEQVRGAFDSHQPPLRWVEQAERLGTGHAVQQALPSIPSGARVLSSGTFRTRWKKKKATESRYRSSTGLMTKM